MVDNSIIYNVPGVRSRYIDTYDRGYANPTGKSIVLMGVTSNDVTGSDGYLALPINEPYRVVNNNTAIYLTRNHDTTPSELTEALFEAIEGGADNIYIMRIGQVYSYEGKICEVITTSDYEVTAFSSDAGAQSLFANATLLTASNRFDYLTTAYAALEEIGFDYIVPIAAYIDDSIESGTKDFGYQAGLFCYRASQMLHNTRAVMPVHTALEHAYKTVSTTNYRTGNPTTAQLVTWKNMLTMQDTSDNYGVKNFDPKTPGLFSIFPEDDETTADPTNHAYFLNSSYTVTPTTISDSSVVKDLEDGAGAPLDLGKYLVPVAINGRFYNRIGKELYPTYGYYNKNSYVAVAGILSYLPTNTSLTNLQTSLRIQESKLKTTIPDMLTGFGYVTLVQRTSGRYFTTGYTAAYHVSPYKYSDYHLEFNLRATFDIVQKLREELTKILGNRGAQMYEGTAKKWLAKYVSDGTISGFSVTFQKVRKNLAVGNLIMSLTLEFVDEVRSITINTAVSSVM